CEEVAAFQTTTNASGLYTFNPYSSSSPDLDNSQIVPAGPIGIAVSGPAGSYFARRAHAYDENCTIPYNGSSQSVPCKRHDIEMEPMNANEFIAEQLAFLEDDCGL
ncbi:MAG: hypothetical protein AAFY60_11265, partial [Myxococcota bacterium]